MFVNRSSVIQNEVMWLLSSEWSDNITTQCGCTAAIDNITKTWNVNDNDGGDKFLFISGLVYFKKEEELV